MTTYVRFMSLDSLLRARLSGLDVRAFAEIVLCMRAHGVRGATRANDRTFQPFGAFEFETIDGTMSRVARARNRARENAMYARVRPRRNARARRRASSRVDDESGRPRRRRFSIAVDARVGTTTTTTTMGCITAKTTTTTIVDRRRRVRG